MHSSEWQIAPLLQYVTLKPDWRTTRCQVMLLIIVPQANNCHAHHDNMEL